jgi:subtilase family serine protease
MREEMHLKKLLTLIFAAALLSFATLNSAKPASAHVEPPHVHYRYACAMTRADVAHCTAIVVDGSIRSLKTAATPPGYAPTDLQNAYNLPSRIMGQGQTVAIVDAYDDPRAETDLATYRNQFGLPACTKANGCFRKVNQTGGTSYPRPDSGWAEEISLDLDMVSAICPWCHILLVEAKNASFSNLGIAVNTAAKLGANVISNSYGGDESSDENTYASYYNHPGVVITASAGDNGYGVEVPAAYNTVVAVGGTSLILSPNARGWSETVWSGTGSGCSAYISKPSWQTDSDCAKRTVGDVSAIADPNAGVAVYDTYGILGGWLVFGGTSVSSPIIASVYALAGNAKNIKAASSLYAHSDSLNDVTSGSNGNCETYLCNGEPGYDAPSGLGTPNGIGAF